MLDYIKQCILETNMYKKYTRMYQIIIAFPETQVLRWFQRALLSSGPISNRRHCHLRVPKTISTEHFLHLPMSFSALDYLGEMYHFLLLCQRQTSRSYC